MFASDIKRGEVGSIWADPHAYSTTLLSLAVDEFGTECFTWEPETIRLQVYDLYKADIPQCNMDKLMALITVHTTDLFYTSVEAFLHIANALNGAEADFYAWDPVDANEAAWAITEVVMNDPLRPEEDLRVRFSAEVLRYLGVILEQEGITTPPDVLRIADMGDQTKPADITFADDPAIYAGFYRLSQSKSDEVVKYVRGSMQQLFQQLNALPLQNRDSERWSAFMQRVAQKAA